MGTIDESVIAVWQKVSAPLSNDRDSQVNLVAKISPLLLWGGMWITDVLLNPELKSNGNIYWSYP